MTYNYSLLSRTLICSSQNLQVFVRKHNFTKIIVTVQIFSIFTFYNYMVLYV